MILAQNHIAEGNKTMISCGNPENVNVFGRADNIRPYARNGTINSHLSGSIVTGRIFMGDGLRKRR